VPGFFTGFIAATGLWILRELLGHSLRKASDRTGDIGFVPERCGFYSTLQADDGRQIDAQFHPDILHTDWDTLLLQIGGELYNDSDVPLLLKKVSVRFFHPDGLRIQHGSPLIEADGASVSVITVPAHGTCRITIRTHISRARLQDTYAGTIPVLHAISAANRTFDFHLAHISFYGDRTAAWPRRGKLPIFVESALPEVTEGGTA
jgi:hypothetical protein